MDQAVYSSRMSLTGEKGKAPSVWAIVLTYGGEEITAACIDSLLAQDYASLTTLLVDNASSDGSGERLRVRYPQIRYLNTGANLGYTGGNNRGIAYALERGAEYLLILNNDTVVEPDCVSLLVESTRGLDKVGVVAPKILCYDDPGLIWYAGGDYSVARTVGIHRRAFQRDTPDEGAQIVEVTFATGCAFLMPAGVARETGGFRDEFFMYCEDVELSLRLNREGYRLYYQPAARLLHRESMRRNGATPFQIVHRDRNRRRIARLHYSVWQRALFSLWFYPSRVARLAQFALRRDWARVRAVISGATSPL